MRLHESLPDSPTFGITWNQPAEERRPIAWGVFPEHWATIETGVKNPIRAALVRVLVLTGLRSLDARTIEWADIEGLDGNEPTLFRPCPTGGPSKAFRVPLSAEVARILRRRQADNEARYPGGPLAFPTAGRDGSVTHIKNAEEDALRGFGYTPHIFASACEEAGLSVLATKLLLNPRDRMITEGYQKLSMDHLRGELERVTAFLLGKARAGENEAGGVEAV